MGQPAARFAASGNGARQPVDAGAAGLADAGNDLPRNPGRRGEQTGGGHSMRRAMCGALMFLLPVAAWPAELRFAIAGDPKTFDPLQVSESHSETVRYLTGGVLIRVNRTT